MCSLLGGRKSKSRSLSFSLNWASAAAASVSSTVLYSTSCRRFYGGTSLLCEAKKNGKKKRSSNDDEEVLQLSKVIIRRVKMVLQMPPGTTRLENAQIFRKVRKPPFPVLFLVNRCVNDVKRVCRGRIEGALPPTFTTTRKPDVGWVSDWWHSLVKNSSIGCESFISGLSSPSKKFKMNDFFFDADKQRHSRNTIHHCINVILLRNRGMLLSGHKQATRTSWSIIVEFLMTCWPWKPVRLDGHLDCLHFETSGF